ncbi:MAG: hypothetical protein HXY42_01370 [Chloroflexi bacterium]|nr:hypothetical protein [Chloroflexota bacterium]
MKNPSPSITPLRFGYDVPQPPFGGQAGRSPDLLEQSRSWKPVTAINGQTPLSIWRGVGGEVSAKMPIAESPPRAAPPQ